MSNRLDKYLADQKIADSRTRAAAMIEAGLIRVNGTVQKKPSFDVPEGALVEKTGELLPYVSRGGLKLEGALDAFCLNVNRLVCADIGSSTGGFTDCLLQRGAARVYAIDSGKDQLHPVLRADPRVVVMEECNARALSADLLGEQVDLVVTDVSFISQTLLHKAIASVLKDGGVFVSLIKPQFEVGRANVGKGGIVRDAKSRRDAARRVMISAMTAGLSPERIISSPIAGGDGNVEYLALFLKQSARAPIPSVDQLP